MFIDTHAHLTDKVFDDDRNEIIAKMREALVEGVITSGTDIASSKEAVRLAEGYPDIFASVGVYPENIYEIDDNFEKKMGEILSSPKAVAVGEIGLQYTEGAPAREEQKECFLRQLQLAYIAKKPVIIHCREAYGDLLDILKGNKHLLTRGGTLHCYSGSLEVAKELIGLGFYISVGGVSTFKNAQRVKEVIAALPLERMLLETDCPYLAPHPYRGQRNSPIFIPTIAQNLAEIKHTTVEEVARLTTANAKELFRI